MNKRDQLLKKKNIIVVFFIGKQEETSLRENNLFEELIWVDEKKNGARFNLTNQKFIRIFG